MSEIYESEKFKKLMAEEEARLLKEYEVIETASWIGNTGLDEETERELAHFIRREFGESIYDEGSLKASDLEYLGIFDMEEGPTHFWKIPSNNKELFAYVAPFEDDNYCLGFGDRRPPNYP
jgi:hypothetical protein